MDIIRSSIKAISRMNKKMKNILDGTTNNQRQHEGSLNQVLVDLKLIA